MTRQKTFKRRVRERMAKTGESYTAARRMLIARGDRPETPRFEPPVAEERVVEATGRGWQAWFELLDAWEAASRTHTEIARWLRDEHAVDGWYSQSITLGYERARGLREPGQRRDGFVAGASRTIAVPVERLFEMFVDEQSRKRWLPAAELRERTATFPRTARYDWEDGSTRVVVGFEGLGEAKSRVALSHERLPDAETAGEMKTWWRARLTELKSRLEDG
ncbi:MAG TPA: hypothetical protein VFY47_05755 [Thermoleophilaceae bacterium]|nr:hypothetical protein [Thermoleophilaceae bacterium]